MTYVSRLSAILNLMHDGFVRRCHAEGYVQDFWFMVHAIQDIYILQIPLRRGIPSTCCNTFGFFVEIKLPSKYLKDPPTPLTNIQTTITTTNVKCKYIVVFDFPETSSKGN